METMPFGKYKGQRLDQINRQYLLWVLRNCELREPLKQEIERVVSTKDQDDMPALFRRLYQAVMALKTDHDALKRDWQEMVAFDETRRAAQRQTNHQQPPMRANDILANGFDEFSKD